MKYSQIDHSHCWTSKKPPCGQRIEHLKCCLCEKLNPKAIDTYREGVMKKIDKVLEYTEHTRNCIRDTFSAGEPTEDGGYRQKFNGKWYESRPIDRTPKCNCGLDEAYETIKDMGV